MREQAFAISGLTASQGFVFSVFPSVRNPKFAPICGGLANHRTRRRFEVMQAGAGPQGKKVDRKAD